MAINDKGNNVDVLTLDPVLGKAQYKCPICDSQVRYIKATKNRSATFRHKSGAECPLYGNRRGDFSEESLMGW